MLGWGGPSGELLLSEGRASVWEQEKVLYMDGGDSYTAMGMHLMPLNCMLNQG